MTQLRTLSRSEGVSPYSDAMMPSIFLSISVEGPSLIARLTRFSMSLIAGGGTRAGSGTGTRLIDDTSRWPAPGSEDTELGVLMELEVGHGETKVYTRVQA